MSDCLFSIDRCVDLVNNRLQDPVVDVVCQSVQVHVAQVRSTHVHLHTQEGAEGALKVDEPLAGREG